MRADGDNHKAASKVGGKLLSFYSSFIIDEDIFVCDEICCEEERLNYFRNVVTVSFLDF